MVLWPDFLAKATLFTCCHHIPRKISTNFFSPAKTSKVFEHSTCWHNNQKASAFKLTFPRIIASIHNKH